MRPTVWLTSFCALTALHPSLQQQQQQPPVALAETHMPGMIPVQINSKSNKDLSPINPTEIESPAEIIILPAPIASDQQPRVVAENPPLALKSTSNDNTNRRIASSPYYIAPMVRDVYPTLPPFNANPTYPPQPPPTVAPFMQDSTNPQPTDSETASEFPTTDEYSVDVDDTGIQTDATVNPDDTLEVRVIDLSNGTDMEKLIKDVLGDLDSNVTIDSVIAVDPIPTGENVNADDADTLPVIPLEAVLLPNPAALDNLHNPSAQETVPSNGSTTIESARPSGQFFCFAQCLAFCMNSDLTEHTRCNEYCTDYERQLRCEPADMDCWKRCNSAFSNPSYAPQSTPQIGGASYLDDPTYTEQFVRIFWQPVPNATLYAVEIIPNPSSMVSGAVLTRDITDMVYYNFKKPNLCFEYYIRVAAVNQFGVGQFSQSTFIQNTVSQLPLSFAISDASMQDVTSPTTGPSIILDPITDQILVRLQYAESFNHFSLENFDVQSYVLATDCKNPVDESVFLATSGSNDFTSKLYRIADATVGAFTDDSFWLYFPKEFVQYDCIYSFRVSSITNTCGKVFSLAHEGKYDSIVGVDFRLNCHTVENSACVDVVDNTQQPEPNMSPDIFATNEEPPNADMSPADSASEITCAVEGFTVEIVGQNSDNTKLNATIFWYDDMLSDDSSSSIYFMRHGTALRVIPVVMDDVTFDYEDPVPVVKSHPDAFMMTVNIQSVDKDSLHSFQICKVPNGSPLLANFEWDGAMKHTVDFSGYVPSTVADNSGKNQKIPVVVISEAATNDNASVTFVLISLIVITVCFAITILMSVHYICRNCNRQRRKLAAIKQDEEKPVAIIAA